MAIISAATIIRSLSIFHLTVAYYLLTAPAKIADQNLVFILGAAMDLPSATSTFTTPSPPLAFLSAILALSGLSDLAATGSLARESSQLYWSSQAPVRLLFFFFVTSYAWAFKPGGLGTEEGSGSGRGGGRPGWDNLKNSLVFSWGFLEMMVWFW
ncbi:hypothetical protein MMC07_002968, partial [Pseudocyphellaria aurata]|nr:hypothetical protein [Pseudocyphellaria aurata]